MKRTILAVSMLVFSSTALTGTLYLNNQPCNTVGNSIDCPTLNAGQNEAARAARAETNRLKAKARQLDECLRKADWPGMPSRSECREMYGE